MFEDKNSVMCRLCLQHGDSPIEIFDPNGNHGVLVWKTIKELVDFEVSQGDGLPSTICRDCMRKLIYFKYFKKRCLNSRTELMKVKGNEVFIVPEKMAKDIDVDPLKIGSAITGIEDLEKGSADMEEETESESCPEIGDERDVCEPFGIYFCIGDGNSVDGAGDEERTFDSEVPLRVERGSDPLKINLDCIGAGNSENDSGNLKDCIQSKVPLREDRVRDPLKINLDCIGAANSENDSGNVEDCNQSKEKGADACNRFDNMMCSDGDGYSEERPAEQEERSEDEEPVGMDTENAVDPLKMYFSSSNADNSENETGESEDVLACKVPQKIEAEDAIVNPMDLSLSITSDDVNSEGRPGGQEESIEREMNEGCDGGDSIKAEGEDFVGPPPECSEPGNNSHESSTKSSDEVQPTATKIEPLGPGECSVVSYQHSRCHRLGGEELDPHLANMKFGSVFYNVRIGRRSEVSTQPPGSEWVGGDLKNVAWVRIEAKEKGDGSVFHQVKKLDDLRTELYNVTGGFCDGSQRRTVRAPMLHIPTQEEIRNSEYCEVLTEIEADPLGEENQRKKRKVQLIHQPKLFKSLLREMERSKRSTGKVKARLVSMTAEDRRVLHSQRCERRKRMVMMSEEVIEQRRRENSRRMKEWWASLTTEERNDRQRRHRERIKTRKLLMSEVEMMVLGSVKEENEPSHVEVGVMRV